MARKDLLQKMANETVKQAKEEAKMEKGLRSYGTKTNGGYSMTVGQLQEYFKAQQGRKHRQRSISLYDL